MKVRSRERERECGIRTGPLREPKGFRCKEYFGFNRAMLRGPARMREILKLIPFPMTSLDISIDLILPAALWLWGLLSHYEK
jgi:hypothetical protein